MAGLLYLQYALVALALLIGAVWLWHDAPTRAALLAVPIAGALFYDNVILALGPVLGAGPLLLALNWPRYLLVALVAPLFVPLFADLGGRAGVTWLNARPIGLLVAAITLVLAGHELALVRTLTLEPLVSSGAVRYVPVAPGPPLVGLAIVLAALAVGTVIWRARRWPWLALAALAAIIGSGAATALGREAICLVTNAVELVLLAAALAWERQPHLERVGPIHPRAGRPARRIV